MVENLYSGKLEDYDSEIDRIVSELYYIRQRRFMKPLDPSFEYREGKLIGDWKKLINRKDELEGECSCN